jgi:tripartite-type tricarboxylate transporter receptor subunit TctC
MLRSLRVISMIAGVALSAATLFAQDYPNKPIRILAPPAGGPGDYVARQIAQAISPSLGRPVVVENRVAQLSAELVAKSAPDGYALLLAGGGSWLTALLHKMPYDMAADVSPIIMITKEVNVFLVHPSLPVRTIRQLIALAKARPGELNYSSSGTGSSWHLAGELFKVMAGVRIVHVPYKGGNLANTALLSGEVQMTITGAGTVLQLIKAGRVRAIAVTSAQRSALLPDLPTVAADLPGYEAVGVTGMWVPAKTPPAIIARLNQEIQRYLNHREVQDEYLSRGSEVVGGTPDVLGSFVRNDIDSMSRVIREAGIKED